MKLLKCSDKDQVLNYDLVYPERQQDIKDLQLMRNRNTISITIDERNEVGSGLMLKYPTGEELIVG